MKRLLVTGFEPFGGSDINPSELVLNALAAPPGAQLIKRVLPVEFARAGELLERCARAEQVDVILSLGQAGGAAQIRVERVALNLDCCLSADGAEKRADEAGDAPVDRVISARGPAAYFSNLPVWELVRALNAAGVGCCASYSAGGFVCNHVMYAGLEIAARTPGLLSGFVHLPLIGSPAREGGKYMEFAQMLKGVQLIADILARG